MSIDYKLIGERIKTARRSAGMTQEKLAEMLDVSVGYISQVERAITKPNLDLLSDISSAVSCDLAELITGSSTEHSEYLISEISTEVSKLSPSERRIVYGLISLLNENRK